MKNTEIFTEGPVIKGQNEFLVQNDEAFKQSMIDMQGEMENYINVALAEW